jgi:hypothetical protein
MARKGAPALRLDFRTPLAPTIRDHTFRARSIARAVRGREHAV